MGWRVGTDSALHKAAQVDTSLRNLGYHALRGCWRRRITAIPADALEYKSALYNCKSILTKLQQISDAPTSRPNTNHTIRPRVGAWNCMNCQHRNTTSVSECSECGKHRPQDHLGAARNRPTGTSKIPEGVRLTASTEKLREAPSKQFSLWAHYSHRMDLAARARDIGKLLLLAACATRDYEQYTGKRRKPNYADMSSEKAHYAQVNELLSEYNGCPSLEAALYLSTSERWVRRQRVLNGRDPDYGHERENDQTTATILRMSASGASIRVIADEIGLSKSVVHRRLEAAQAA